MALLVAVVGLASGLLPASAQENLDRGRTPAQLFVSDCADCHRNPRAVLKTISPRSLPDFLREHYTASRESAAALSTYLLSQVPDPKAAPAARVPARPTTPRPAKPAEAKPPESKPTQAKPAETTPAAKPADEAKPETPPAAPAEPASKS
jgi:hypothetical protein